MLAGCSQAGSLSPTHAAIIAEDSRLPLARPREAKSVGALLALVLISVHLGKVLCIIKCDCQSGVVKIARRFHSGYVRKGKRQASCEWFCDC